MADSSGLGQLFAVMTDSYERRARLAPALLVLLPLIVAFMAAFKKELNTLELMASVTVAGCAPFLLSNLVRFRGKNLEKKLVAKWGAMPTTQLLRHRDVRLNPHLKARYHVAIRDKLGVRLPSEAEELADPASADQAYSAAVSLLRERTRKEESLLLHENATYGFYRNMSAVRKHGLFSSLLGLAFGLLMSRVIGVAPLSFNPEALSNPGFSGAITLCVSVILAAVWLSSFSHEMVEHAAFAYADRLLASLDRL